LSTLPQAPAQHTDHHGGKHVPEPAPKLSSRVHLRGALVPLVVGLLIGPIFAAVYLAAFHAPVPHELPVAVVGSAQVVSSVTQKSSENGDPFAVVEESSRVDAVHAVLNRDVYGALVVATGKTELIVAGANGPSVTQTLQGAFTPLASAVGTTLEVTDVKPLPAGDSRGLSVFYAAFGIVLGAFLFGLTIMGVGRQLPHFWRAGSAVIFSLLAGLVVAWLVDPVFGALPGPYLLTAGVIAMLGLAIAASTAMLMRVFGAAGTFVSSIVLLTLGNATSTGILPAQFLPTWLEPLTEILPVGVAVRALRGGAYFNNDGVATAFIVLGIWIILSAAIFGLLHEFQARRSRRASATAPNADVESREEEPEPVNVGVGTVLPE
jgi:hypothetical protein